MSNARIQRQPVVAVVGHIDHGKSTLLDYIRKSNVVEGEAGGITQHLSAYEVLHKTKEGAERNITFLDTPGHAAFEKMRSRGLEVADVAILVVSAEEGVKPQTLEAVKLIRSEDLPFIVAINKIDREGANIDRTKSSLIENEIYVEGMGGDIPSVPISAKRGDGINELLDLIVLAADLKELSYDPSASAVGTIIEASVDTRKGIGATLIIKDGTLESGSFVVSGESFAPVRIMEDFAGRQIKTAHAGQPVRIIGFSSLPQIGGTFSVVANKKEAEALVADRRRERLVDRSTTPTADEEQTKAILPIVIKADVAGTIDAIKHEIANISEERLDIRVVSEGVGGVTEGDVKMVVSGTPGIVLGFNAKVDASARDLAERQGVTIETFDIIYKLAEWLQAEARARAPRHLTEEITGAAKVLKVFNENKGKVVLGGRVEEGVLEDGAQIKLMRRDLELGRGHIESLQTMKAPAKRVEQGAEFGAMIDIDAQPAAGDRLECFVMVEK